MGAFDTPIVPTALSPANTTAATLFTAGANTSLLVQVANLTSSTVAIRVGVIPSGGSVFYLMYDMAVPANDALEPYGPVFLRNGDAIEVRTAIANAVTFSVTGVKSS